MPIEKEDLNEFADALAEKLQDKLTIAILPLASKLDNLDKIVEQHKKSHEKQGGFDDQISENTKSLSRILWMGGGAISLLTVWEAVKAVFKVAP